MKKLIILGIFVSAAVAVGYLAPSPVHALSCLADTQTLAYNRDAADIVFRGTVTNRGDTASAFPGAVSHSSDVMFRVSEYWKGTLNETVVVTGPRYAWGTQQSPEYAFFQVGQEYLVFASRTPAGNYEYQLDCGGNRQIQYAGVFLQELGKGSRPSATVVNPPPVQPPPVTPSPESPYTRNLTLGDTGNDVSRLQSFLESKGLLNIPRGVAKGYFGAMTRAALARYQASVGITPAVGYFGPITRAKVNAEK